MVCITVLLCFAIEFEALHHCFDCFSWGHILLTVILNLVFCSESEIVKHLTDIQRLPCSLGIHLSSRARRLWWKPLRSSARALVLYSISCFSSLATIKWNACASSIAFDTYKWCWCVDLEMAQKISIQVGESLRGLTVIDQKDIFSIIDSLAKRCRFVPCGTPYLWMEGLLQEWGR